MKGIIFAAESVCGILDGRKTMTRRVAMVPPETHSIYIEDDGRCYAKWGGYADDIHSFVDGETEIKPRYKVGDILYVKETWCEYARVDERGYTHYDDCTYYYATDGDYQIWLCDADGFSLDDQRMKWHSSRYMPCAAARIFLRVTDVRVERLQEISEEDAIAEGVNWHDGKNVGIEEKMRRSAIDRYRELWDSLNAKPGKDWNSNPWVWAYTFERISKEEAENREKA